MPGNLARKRTPEEEGREREFYRQIKIKKDKKAGSNIPSRPVSWPNSYSSARPENEPESADSQEEGEDQPKEADSVQERPGQSAEKPPVEEKEGKEDVYKRQLNNAKQAAKTAAKEKAKQAMKQAVKVAAKSFWRVVIVPVLSAIGTFIASTWYIWLILAVVIILVVLGYAYGQEIWDKIPSWAQPAFEAIIKQFI